MSNTQRSKSGCWTCRVRKKKCQEGGLPCVNCSTLGVLCHGYGPRPVWKDRGEKEKEVASRLFPIKKRRGPRRTQSLSKATTVIPTPSSPLSTSASHFSTDLCQSSSSQETSITILSPERLTSETLSQQWLHEINVLHHDGIETSALDTFGGDSWLTSAPEGFGDLRAFLDTDNAENGNSTLVLTFPSTSGPDLTTSRITEHEMSLIMRFIDEHESFRISPGMNRGWLLSLLTHSRAFFYASMSLSALRESQTFSLGPTAQDTALLEHRRCRDLAIASYDELTTRAPSSIWLQIVCAIHLAELEARTESIVGCETYLKSAAKLLCDEQRRYLPILDVSLSLLAEDRLPEPSANPSSHLPLIAMSAFETAAMRHSCCNLIWNDIVLASTQRHTLQTEDVYRKILAAPSFTPELQHVIGFESWALVSMMDVTALDIWKRDLEVLGCLSIRDLAKRASVIEETIEKGIEDLSCRLAGFVGPREQGNQPAVSNPTMDASQEVIIRTNVLIHAVLVDLHVTVSGPSSSVPEVKNSLDRAIAAWKLCSFSTSMRGLSWAYYVSASLANGQQRDAFRTLGSEFEFAPLHDSRVLIEKCWNGRIRRDSRHLETVEWRNILRETRTSVLFT